MHLLELPSVEYSLTEHCNLRCSGCDHASPLLPEYFTPPAMIERDLTMLASVARLGCVKLIGGEPLLHPQVVELAHLIRALPGKPEVQLLSNGLLLDRLPDESFRSFDKIEVTRYPNVKYRMTSEEMVAKGEALGVVVAVREANAFRKTLLNRPVANQEFVKAIYGGCFIAHFLKCRSVYDGYFYKCSVAPFMPKRLALAGVVDDALAPAVAGVRLHENPTLRDDLERYLSAEDGPLRACAYCLGTAGVHYPHKQLTKAECRAELHEELDVDTLVRRDVFHLPLAKV